MKISEMIENLQKFMEEHGDLECWYTKDDEGNGYQAIYFKPSFMYANEDGDVFDEEVLDEINEEDKEDLIPICVVN